MSRSRRLSAAAVAVLAAVALPGWFQATPGTASSLPRVSVISDSILTSVTWSTDGSLATLSNGLDLQIDAGVCRRLNGQSCEFNGAYVPTTLSVINSWITQLGSIVVIVDGYNDIPDSVCRRRRAHAQHPARPRRSARALGEPPQHQSRVRREERRAGSGRAASSRAPRARLEQLRLAASRLVPDGLDPPAARRAATRSPPGCTRRSPTRLRRLRLRLPRSQSHL